MGAYVCLPASLAAAREKSCHVCEDQWQCWQWQQLLVYHRENVAEKLCKCGLKVSGRKDELVNQLMTSQPLPLNQEVIQPPTDELRLGQIPTIKNWWTEDATEASKDGCQIFIMDVLKQNQDMLNVRQDIFTLDLRYSLSTGTIPEQKEQQFPDSQLAQLDLAWIRI